MYKIYVYIIYSNNYLSNVYIYVYVCKIPRIDHHSFEIADNNFTFIALLLQFKQLQPLVRGVYKAIGGEMEKGGGRGGRQSVASRSSLKNTFYLPLSSFGCGSERIPEISHFQVINLQ